MPGPKPLPPPQPYRKPATDAPRLTPIQRRFRGLLTVGAAYEKGIMDPKLKSRGQYRYALARYRQSFQQFEKWLEGKDRRGEIPASKAVRDAFSNIYGHEREGFKQLEVALERNPALTTPRGTNVRLSDLQIALTLFENAQKEAARLQDTHQIELHNAIMSHLEHMAQFIQGEIAKGPGGRK